MGSVLTMSVSAYFFIISYRLYYAYLLFIFLIPFLPKYIGFGFGSEGFALSLKRILLMILFLSLLISLTQNKKYIFKRFLVVYQQNKMIINVMLLLFLLKVLSLTLNSGELSLYIMLFNDFLFSILIFILTILLINSEEMIIRLMKIFFYSYSIVLLLVLVESIVKFPLLSIFASGQMELDRDVSESFVRGGGYRTLGSFTNPIVLGNYLVVLFPIVIAYINRNGYVLMLNIGYLILFLFAIYSTGSRSAVLMFAALVYFYLILNLYKDGQFYRFIAFMLNLIVVSIVSYFVFIYMKDLIVNFHGRFDLLGDKETISSTSRALQFIFIYEKIQESPLFGFGRNRNFITEFDFFAIDNYYLWIILEIGIIGILVYFLFFISLVKSALSQYKLSHKNYYLLPLLISILLMICYQVLSAVPDNLIYLYIFAGLISVMKVLQK